MNCSKESKYTCETLNIKFLYLFNTNTYVHILEENFQIVKEILVLIKGNDDFIEPRNLLCYLHSFMFLQI